MSHVIVLERNLKMLTAGSADTVTECRRPGRGYSGTVPQWLRAALRLSASQWHAGGPGPTGGGAVRRGDIGQPAP